MKDFNHLKNLCEFLCDVDNFNKCFVDDDAQYDEDAARDLFSEHVYNLLLQSDVDDQMANRVSDVLTNAFYRTPTKIDVELNALCYAFGQAEDYIPVVY